MSIRPPFSVSNNTFRPRFDNISVLSNVRSTCNMNPNPAIIPNSFVPRVYGINKPNQDLFTTNNLFNEFSCDQQSVDKVSLPSPNTLNYNFSVTPIPSPQTARFCVPNNRFYPPQSVVPNNNINSAINHFDRNSDTTYFNNHQNSFSNPEQNVGYTNLSRNINFYGYMNNACPIQNVPGNNIANPFNLCSQSALTINRNTNIIVTTPDSNSTSVPEDINNSVVFTGNSGNPMAVPPILLNSAKAVSPQLHNTCSFHIPPPKLQNEFPYMSVSDNVLNTDTWEKDLKLCKFLTKFSRVTEKKGSQITVPEFRSILKAAFSIIKLLSESKGRLKTVIDSNENEWNCEVQSVSNLQEQLSEICSLVSAPVHLNAIVKKLKFIKRKRELKKKTKLNQLSQKIKVEQNKLQLNQEIDKYLDDIKEKNLKLKREAEMKKEADFILLEVRRKIHEANRTIEKIKVFEKLRNVRQANSIQKGLHIVSDHSEKFEKKISILKETMLKQLTDYEAEEKALKVMLETEQEGQLEEEAQWKLKKMKTLQQKRQNHIKECLFGNSDDPLPADSLFLFHKYHTSANSSIENLAQIRHHWDVHIAEDGEAVPQQWVVPISASNSSWEPWLITCLASKN